MPTDYDRSAHGMRYASALVGLAAGVVGVLLLLQYFDTLPAAAPLPDQEFHTQPAQVRPLDAVDLSSVDTRRDHLIIGSLGVDAPIEGVALTGGVLQLPEEVSHAGLWHGSAATDADRGTVLVAGHLDSASQERGALHDLATVEAGTTIALVDDGSVTLWKVTGLEAVSKADLPDSVWRGDRGPRRLYVITCGGPIVNGHYTDNVVVTAAPVKTRQTVS